MILEVDENADDAENEHLWLIERSPVVKWAFADESGSFRSHDCFVLGMVLATDVDRAEADLEAICTRHDYPHEVKFADLRRYSFSVAIAMIEYFLTCQDLTFQCIYKRKGVYDLRRYANDRGIPRQDLAYNHTYRRFLEFKLDCDIANVVIDQRSRSPHDNLLDYLYREVPQIANIREGNSKDYRLLQLADVLVGAVNNALTEVANPHKKGVRDHLCDKMGLKTLTEDRRDGQFGVWKWRPPT